ncbi:MULTISPECIES: 6-phosphofructokinase [unclassified Enterococcus]|uniref:6-phosphofructokinase n=1 Tax=unclassified Enterococcus TaxID=2608891 RepID=UPI001A9B9EC4|nr:6-phosphofructokinase [Enterococcus sp. DIV1271a]MBO1301208.1 6-phosphofructokinase [Enterococcus sp. DIV1271a]
MAKKVGILSIEGYVKGAERLVEQIALAAPEQEIELLAISYTEEQVIKTKLDRNANNWHLFDCSYLSMVTNQAKYEFLQSLKKDSYDCLIVLGGTMSVEFANELRNHGFPVITVPVSNYLDYPSGDYTVGSDTFINGVAKVIDRIVDTGHSHQKVTFIQIDDTHSGKVTKELSLTNEIDVCIASEFDLTTNKKYLLKHMSSHPMYFLLNRSVSSIESFVATFCPTLSDYRSIVLDNLAIGQSMVTAFDRISVIKLGHAVTHLLDDGCLDAELYFSNGKVLLEQSLYDKNTEKQIAK